MRQREKSGRQTMATDIPSGSGRQADGRTSSSKVSGGRHLRWEYYRQRRAGGRQTDLVGKQADLVGRQVIPVGRKAIYARQAGDRQTSERQTSERQTGDKKTGSRKTGARKKAKDLEGKQRPLTKCRQTEEARQQAGSRYSKFKQ
jgi:hypothetical protein